jgi:hypothetical protein
MALDLSKKRAHPADALAFSCQLRSLASIPSLLMSSRKEHNDLPKRIRPGSLRRAIVAAHQRFVHLYNNPVRKPGILGKEPSLALLEVAVEFFPPRRGSNISAWGNAPGTSGPTKLQKPRRGATHAGERSLFRPYRAFSNGIRPPRALPWADASLRLSRDLGSSRPCTSNPGRGPGIPGSRVR